MKAILQNFVGTTDEWESENPVLYDGVFGIEILHDGTRRSKIGDGVTPWQLLAYSNGDLPWGIKPSVAMPLMDGLGNPGDDLDSKYSKGTHQHPRDNVLTEAILVEAEIRSNIDNIHEIRIGKIDNTINAWIGRGGYLTQNDFGSTLPSQQDLTDYALSEIGLTEPINIWNGTKIKNIHDDHEWVLTNTPDTDPPIFEWTDQGISNLNPFETGRGGYVVGADPIWDGPGYVIAQPGGKAKVDMDLIRKALIPPGRFSYETITNEIQLAEWRMIPADGRTISITDPRADRLLIYNQIPYATAQANPDIIGLYRTNDNFPTHQALAQSGKQRATPAENGLYFAIPDACGLFFRGAGQNATKRGANNTPYDGKLTGSFEHDSVGIKNGQFKTYNIGGGANGMIFDVIDPFLSQVQPINNFATVSFTTLADSYTQIISLKIQRSGEFTKPGSLSTLICVSY